MRGSLLLRSLAYYWRTNAAVVLGVGTAVAVLSGALMVGDSVRGSLRDLALLRLGRAEHVLSTSGFFREDLARVLSDPAASPRLQACPMVILEGVVTHAESGRRASGVAVYGVDPRFWSFHGRSDRAPRARSALASESLAAELGAGAGSALLVRVEQPSDVSAATLFGRRDQGGRTLRLTLEDALAASELGEFSIRPGQQSVRAVFMPLSLAQRALARERRVNTVLLREADETGARDADARGPAAPSSAEAVAAAVREALALEDLGLRVRPLPGPGVVSLESAGGLVSDADAEAARAAAGQAGFAVEPVLAYLANAIRVGPRATPYSLVAGLAPASARALGLPALGDDEVVLNDWTAADLAARPGDTVVLEYYSWLEEGRLETRMAPFRLAAVAPLAGAVADPHFAPDYPGITGSADLADWDPPFPLDLGAVRPKDEEYWDRHRATPKAFVALARGQELWRHRLGALTSVRVRPPEGADLTASADAFARTLRGRLDPFRRGVSLEPVRALALAASEGATDFGVYFVSFSAFLVASALLLAALFFRLGVEQRGREIGLLRAVGYPPSRLLRRFLGEGLALAAAGSALGTAGAWAYASLMLLGLGTVWVDAVGTRRLELHASTSSLVLGAAGGIVTALVCIAWTLRGLRRATPRALLGGATADPAREAAASRTVSRLAAAAVFCALVLLGAAAASLLGDTPAFFGAGTLLLAAALGWQWRWLAASRRAAPGIPLESALGLGARGAWHRPGRSLLSIALIAFASFIIVAVGAFRRDGDEAAGRSSGSGGYPLLARSLLPLHHDPGTPEGRAALGLDGADASLDGVRFARFRLRPGEDASCLNLYRPGAPTLLGATPAFVAEGRFAFQGSLASTAEERANPWRLLDRDEPDGALPAIADANSMTYVLHRALGESMVLERPGREPLRLRFVAALRDSVFQGELLVSERRLLDAFPNEGYRFFLIDVPAAGEAAAAQLLENRLADLGFDVEPTRERLARFHRVENTYLSTFQTLGALGLLLGTLGLGVVIVRNALERRRELALLRVVGYRVRHLTLMIAAENAVLLAAGLGTGTACALVAIAPAVWSRGGRLPFLALGALLLAVAGTGLLVSRLAVAVVQRSPVLAALRSE
jgi:hypothetical protein